MVSVDVNVPSRIAARPCSRTPIAANSMKLAALTAAVIPLHITLLAGTMAQRHHAQAS
jgi:hypothetical protein